MDECLRIVIVGHVDHGKSSLIGRLFCDTDSLPEERIEEARRISREQGRELEFAFITDHLEEERSQGITIDISKAFFKSARRRYVIIDAPGHVEFVKNMVTGASQAEAAVLVVDATEGIREQTRRHAHLLSLLGLRQLVAVVNKMDLVDYSRARFEELQSGLSSFLAQVGMIAAHTIPISAHAGDNIVFPSDTMTWHPGPTLLDALDGFEAAPEPSDMQLRFPVQDVYRVDGREIVVGRVETGRIRRGDTILLLPSGETTRVHSIEVLWKNQDEAVAGDCIGITFTEPVPVARGAVACHAGLLPSAAVEIQARVFWLSTRPWTPSDPITLRLATQEQPVVMTPTGRVNSSTLAPIDGDCSEVNHTEVADVLLRTPRPVIAEPFTRVRELGRFVLVREQEIVAGGIVTDVAGRPGLMPACGRT